MKRVVLLLVILAAGCAAGEDAPTANRPSHGLTLRVRMLSPRLVMAGHVPTFEVTLANDSTTESFRVVKPGDGSELGWREPHVHWTGTIDRGDGRPVPLPVPNLGRCKLFDTDWDKDFLRLDPGDELTLDYEPLLDFQMAGTVRLQARYDYDAGHGPNSRTGWKPPYPLNMGGVEPFSVVSETVEFEIYRPLDLTFRAKSAAKVGRASKLDDLFELRLVNRSGKPFGFEAGSGGLIVFEVDREFHGSKPDWFDCPEKVEEAGPLRPGAARSLLNGKEWTPDESGTARMRAALIAVRNESQFVLKSDWIDVRIE
jgi:hypothetical protein